MVAPLRSRLGRLNGQPGRSLLAHANVRLVPSPLEIGCRTSAGRFCLAVACGKRVCLARAEHGLMWLE
ncbi:hypothetical protein ONE63_005433 [Megalurothrips usitatus]|uniref:Uncharacterized protein n=1 Tax=Megalurothrips usitatus TaxID=439358 RepID=A0AAV7XWG1_9NEOP|nr:hypothetical protein ONE63_005433 [Megalurothrips usitatus]